MVDYEAIYGAVSAVLYWYLVAILISSLVVHFFLVEEEELSWSGIVIMLIFIAPTPIMLNVFLALKGFSVGNFIAALSLIAVLMTSVVFLFGTLTFYEHNKAQKGVE